MEAAQRATPGLSGTVTGDDNFKRVAKKVLLPQSFSHEEERLPFLTIEYTPFAVKRPVDALFPLRASREGRAITLLIGVHVQASDDGDALLAALHAISDNVTALDDPFGVLWTSVCVCILVDGLQDLSPALVSVLQTELKLYDPLLLQSHVNGQPVTMHVFEVRHLHTCACGFGVHLLACCLTAAAAAARCVQKPVEMSKHAQAREYYPPLHMSLCIADGGAVGSVGSSDMVSRLWLLSGFGNQLHPQFVMYFARGCIPAPSCLPTVLAVFARNKDVAVVIPSQRPGGVRRFGVVQASQLFVYTARDVFQHCCQSLCGLVMHAPAHVLALRWQASQGTPLGEYFLGQDTSVQSMGPFHAAWYVCPTLLGISLASVRARACVCMRACACV